MNSGCCGAPVRTKQADLNKSQLNLQKNIMTPQPPFSPTKTTVPETKDSLILALFSRQSSARDCETINSPREAQHQEQCSNC